MTHKTKVAFVIGIFLIGAANASIKKEDIDWATSIGWDLAGILRACSRFDEADSYFFDTKSMNVEKSLLQFVRRSKLLEDNYPEIHVSKVWLSAKTNVLGMTGMERIESRAAVVTNCQEQGLRSERFIKRLEDIAAGKRVK